MSDAKIYLDTSVWNLALAEDLPNFREATVEFFNRAREEGWRLFISDVVLAEIRSAPRNKKEEMLDLIEKTNPSVHTMDEEVASLAEEYIRAGVLSENHRNDCLHVACATFLKCDYLLSWNFQHLANIRRAERFVAVNASLGYPKRVWICNPLQVYEI